jgi:hypothetical protein
MRWPFGRPIAVQHPLDHAASHGIRWTRAAFVLPFANGARISVKYPAEIGGGKAQLSPGRFEFNWAHC